MQPTDFRHSTPVDIRFADLDALGHVNNAKYLTYMEHARVRYFGMLRMWDATQAKHGLIMAKVVVEYKLPLLLEDQIQVWTRVSRLGTKSLDTEHVITRQDGEVAATGFIVAVVYNYEQKVTVAIPDSWRESLMAYEPILSR